MALEKGTLGSAQALAWDDKIGTLDVGKWADVIVLDPNYPSINPRGRLVTLLVFAGDPDMVDTVIIGGRVVVRHRKHQIWDEEEVVAKANEQQKRLAKAAGTERFMPLKGSRWNYV
jgi:5-methylthioadenosine/S-adenosylhomocysteine deaminase